jgi:hypothetical protein
LKLKEKKLQFLEKNEKKIKVFLTRRERGPILITGK